MTRSEPEHSNGNGRRGWWRVAVVVVLTLFAVYIMRLATGGVALKRAGDQESRLNTAVAVEETAVARIEEAVTTAESDAYAEEYAREKRNLAQPGDRVVVPVPAATTEGGPAPSDASGDWWERFQRWLRGE